MNSAATPVLTGGCQCGAVRFAISAPPTKVSICHCRMCQKAAGAPFASFAEIEHGDFAWTRGTPVFFASSSLARRAFCDQCGTPLSFKYDTPTARMYTTIGSLDHPEGAPIIKQFGIESRLTWVKFCEDVPAERTGESAAAQEFLNWITGEGGQTVLRDGTSYEYAVGVGRDSNPQLKPLADIGPPPVEISQLNSQAVIDLMTAAGLL